MTRVLLDARLAIRGLGIATYLDRLVTALREQDDLAVDVWKAAGEWGPAARVATLTRSGLFDISPRLDPRTRGFDVVHFASNLLSLVPGRRSIVTVYDLLHRRRERVSARDRFTGAVLERSLPRAARVVAISDRTRREVEQAVPSVSGRVEVIPPGMRRLPPASGPRRHILAFGGASDPRKRTNLMVAVYRRYRESTSEPLPLVVLGKAGLTSGQRAALADAAARVVPSATRAEVDTLMAGAAALLYPSSEEGLGLPILEAAEVGTPVVVDAAADVATEVLGRHCFGVAGMSLDSWVHELRQAVAAAPVAAVLDLPDWAGVAERYRSIYAELTDG